MNKFLLRFLIVVVFLSGLNASVGDSYAYGQDQEKGSWLQRNLPQSDKTEKLPRVRRKHIRIYKHDQALKAKRSGKILSLSKIRESVVQRYPGKVVDVSLLVPKKNKKPYLYKVKVLMKNGQVRLVYVNAHNGHIQR